MEGTYTVAAEQLDTAGNVGRSAVSTLVVDVSGPSAAIIGRPADFSRSSTAAFQFSSSDANVTFECRLDSTAEAAFVACSSPKTYPGLADGPHTFSVRARDAVGNTGGVAADTWTTDTRAPGAAISAAPPLTTTSRTAMFAFSVDEPGAKFDCRVDATPSTACTSPQSYGGLADGPHTFAVRAVDAAGNEGFTFWTWTIDTIAPDTAIILGPAPTIDRDDATFDFVATEAGARFECSLDGAAFGSCASRLVLTRLPGGAHTLRVRSWDVAGHVDPSPAAHEWTVSRPAPAPPPAEPDRVPPSEVGGATARAGDGRVTITWTPPADPDFERVVVVRVSPGKSAPSRTVYEGADTALVDRGLTNGVRYRYRITTRDRAGNSSAGVEVAATPRSPLIAPRNGASVSAPPVLRWRPPPRATYYNVQLWLVRAGGQQQAARPVKVLSAWPSTPRLKLIARWVFGGKRYWLVPGSYRWFVFPGFGKRSQARYGALVGQSALTVKGRKAL